MANIASRSASPNPSRSQSPSPREAPNAGKPVKKVPWVNPCSSKQAVFTGPADIPQKNSSSKGGSASLRASFENNENERDPNVSKLNKARSPVAAAPSKGAKNFMSPTISASSKVIAASPKRRILSERNDGTRSSLTSVSDFSDFIESGEDDARLVMGMGPQVPLDTPKVLNEASPTPVESFNFQEPLVDDRLEKRERDPEMENGRSTVITCCSSAIASLDKDPTLPPYDPKTNYLSPRPQFLHYRPKPRIEHYLNREDGFFSSGEGSHLEDRFSSESSEETSDRTEEILSSNPQNVHGDESFSSEVEAGEVRSGAHDPEPTCDDIISSNPNYFSQDPNTHDPEPKCDDIISLKETSESRFLTRPKFIKFFLVMVVVACLSVSVVDTPNISSSPVLKHESLRNPYEPMFRIFDDPYLRGSFVGFKKHANLNVDKLASKLRDWSVNSIARFQSMFPNLVVPKEELGFFYLINTTAMEVDKIEVLKGREMELTKEQGVANGARDVEADKISFVNGVTEETETEDTNDYFKEEAQDDDFNEKTGAETARLGKEAGSSAEQWVVNTTKEEVDDGSEARGHLEHQLQKIEDEIKEEGQLVEISDDVDEEEPQAGIHYHNVPSQADVGIHTDAEEAHGGSREPRTFQHAKLGLGTELPFQTLLGISSVVLALAAIIIALCVRQKHIPAAPYGLPHDKVIPNPTSQSYMHSQSPIHLPEAETMGESGPSEVSSSLQSSLYLGQKRYKRGKEQDTFSHERNLRRDSVASSTSYGSFTTYERLSGKKGYQDEDSLTPVRRSSRIKNQVASP